MSRKILSEDRIHPAATKTVDGKSNAIIDAIEAAMLEHDVVIVGMAQNPHPKKAKRALKAKGVPFHYMEYGSYLSDWRPRLELKMWTGWPTFPMIFVKSQLVGGADDVIALIESGELDSMLAG